MGRATPDFGLAGPTLPVSDALCVALRVGPSPAGDAVARNEDVAVLEPARGPERTVLTDRVLSAGLLLTERRALSAADLLTERAGRFSAGLLCDRIVPSMGLLMDLRTLSVVRNALLVSAGRLADLLPNSEVLLIDRAVLSAGRLAERRGGSDKRPFARPPMGSINLLLDPPLLLSGVLLTERDTGRPAIG